MGTMYANNSQGGGEFKKAPLLPKGVYELELRNISEPRQSTLPEKIDPETAKPIPNRPYMFLDYTIIGGEHGGADWSETAPATLGMGPGGPSKLRARLQGFLGREFADAEPVDPQQIAASRPRATVLIEQVAKADGSGKKNVIQGFIEVTRQAATNAPLAEYDPETLGEVPF